MKRRSLTVAGLLLLSLLGWSSAGWLVAHPAPSRQLVAQVGSSVPVVRYITPTGGGKKDGTTIANAATLASLDSIIAAVGPGGEVHILADRGTYTVTGQISIRHGGTTSAPVTVIGVDAAGKPANVPIVGNRASPYNVSGAAGSEIFRLLTGANNLHFEYFSFTNVGNGAFHIGENLSNLTLEHMQAANVRRFLEDYVAGNATDASVAGLTVRDVTINGYSKGALRIQYDSHNVLIEDVTGDSQRQDGDNFTEGIELNDTAHDVVFRRVTMMNSTDTIHAYWNGDGFSSERGNYNLRFENTTASGNTDAGYDLKSNHVLFVNTLAFDNKDNYKLWGTDDVVLQGITARDPHKRGGTGAQAQFEIAGDGTTVTVKDSTVTDNSPSTVVYHLNGNNQLVTVNNVNVTKNASARLNASDADNGKGSKLVDTTTVSTPAPTVSFSAAAATLTTGGSTVLSWSSTNASTCGASGGWSGALAVSGTRSITPATTTSYSIACIGAGGTTTQTVVITVLPKPVALSLSFTAATTTLISGGSTTLSWNATGATSCTASGGWSGAIGTTGTRIVAPGATTAYALQCIGVGTTTSRTITLTVVAKPSAPVITFSAAPTSVASGGSTTLSWNAANATSCAASGGWSGALATAGTRTLALTGTTTYAIQCVGAGGTASQAVTVSARSSTPPPVAPIVSFAAASTSLVAGGSTVLSWSSTNATTCTASGGWSGALAVSGTRSITPATTTSYSIACIGAGGTTTQSVTIAVRAPSVGVPAPTLAFSAPATTLALGASVPLIWTSTNATSCTASGGWSGALGVSGTRTVTPATTTIYLLLCAGIGGSITRSLTLTVLPSIASGDVNSDGIVNSLDYSLLNKVWGKNDRTKDVNNDGIVNAKDLTLLVQKWFERIAH